jgi:hypothetical protein
MLCILCIGKQYIYIYIYIPHISSRTIIHGDGGVVDICSLFHEAPDVTSDKLTGEGATSDK